MGERSRREIIEAVASDLMSDFMYYDRKEDEDLPVGAIEKAIEDGEITIEEILDIFKKQLES